MRRIVIVLVLLLAGPLRAEDKQPDAEMQKAWGALGFTLYKDARKGDWEAYRQHNEVGRPQRKAEVTDGTFTTVVAAIDETAIALETSIRSSKPHLVTT